MGSLGRCYQVALQAGIDPEAQEVKIMLKKRGCFFSKVSGWEQKEQACNIEIKEGISSRMEYFNIAALKRQFANVAY